MSLCLISNSTFSTPRMLLHPTATFIPAAFGTVQLPIGLCCQYASWHKPGVGMLLTAAVLLVLMHVTLF